MKIYISGPITGVDNSHYRFEGAEMLVRNTFPNADIINPEKIGYFMPFPHMLNSVIEIYLGTVKGTELLTVLFYQIIWILILVLAGHFMLKAGIKHLTILGG